MTKSTFASALMPLLLAPSAFAEPGRECTEWKEAEEVLALDPQILPEASGLAPSHKAPNVFFHINDSGDGPHLYATDVKAKTVARLTIADFSPFDMEDITDAPCGSGHCLVLADIGDNKLVRPAIALVVLDEPEMPSPKAKNVTLTPKRVIKAVYPDGPHNAEALAAHPNGDLFLVTKEKGKKDDPLKARIYRLPAAAWQASGATGKPEKLVFVADLEIKAPYVGEKARSKRITGMDIHPAGDRFILLTYEAALEFKVDLAKVSDGKIPSGSHRALAIPEQPKQEAIAYATDGKGFYYSSESPKAGKKAKKKAVTHNRRLLETAAVLYVGCAKHL